MVLNPKHLTVWDSQEGHQLQNKPPVSEGIYNLHGTQLLGNIFQVSLNPKL